MAEWKQQKLKLPANHGWKARPGHRIFIADRGAVRFEIPQAWQIVPGDSIKFFDRLPEEDADCRLELSVMRLRPDIDWSGVQLDAMLLDLAPGDPRPIQQRGPIQHVVRGPLRIAWYQAEFIDPACNRAARSRIALAFGGNIVPYITFDYWTD